MAGTLVIRALDKAEREAMIDDLAALRITVFRDWPYLYDGDADYERKYLQTYLDAPGAFIAGAFDGATLVGACTATPLSEHANEFAEPFAERGLTISDYFYFGESVLLADYRGQGAGVRFFELREEEARRQGFRFCIFSAVFRPPDHPACPKGYSPLDEFWRKRGYEPLEGFRTTYSWRDVGDTQETAKPMDYWVKALTQR